MYYFEYFIKHVWWPNSLHILVNMGFVLNIASNSKKKVVLQKDYVR